MVLQLYFFILETVSDDEIGAICGMACILLAHKSREIVQSALGLVHVLMSGYGDAISGKFLPDLVSWSSAPITMFILLNVGCIYVEQFSKKLFVCSNTQNMQAVPFS